MDESESHNEIDEEILDKKIVKRFAKMELMYYDLKKEMELMKGRKGDEIDKDKYLTLITKYKNFKKKNVQHFRFNSNSSNFGKSECFS